MKNIPYHPAPMMQGEQTGLIRSAHRIKERLGDISYRLGVLADEIVAARDDSVGGRPSNRTGNALTKPARTGVFGDIEDALDILDEKLDEAKESFRSLCE